MPGLLRGEHNADRELRRLPRPRLRLPQAQSHWPGQYGQTLRRLPPHSSDGGCWPPHDEVVDGWAGSLAAAALFGATRAIASGHQQRKRQWLQQSLPAELSVGHHIALHPEPGPTLQLAHRRHRLPSRLSPGASPDADVHRRSSGRRPYSSCPLRNGCYRHGRRPQPGVVAVPAQEETYASMDSATTSAIPVAIPQSQSTTTTTTATMTTTTEATSRPQTAPPEPVLWQIVTRPVESGRHDDTPALQRNRLFLWHGPFLPRHPQRHTTRR
ncbi:uncharacterized protein SPSK_00869 [Sporothrix schenckii 1099-18]|uniref:Uncharacterized protein n=1 Tax=Sporothrix schenckii 1099-18 TaxID=1397361 RepID=A0A0F2M0A5_SPOSC|nr:uncharacterized protein SPSK_00869 [Sporothrix schenckii 1099-18]KJR81581.1 hypothetical protein SPSK_00869 [Sporothrix schenckii 1099-18]